MMAPYEVYEVWFEFVDDGVRDDFALLTAIWATVGGAIFAALLLAARALP